MTHSGARTRGEFEKQGRMTKMLDKQADHADPVDRDLGEEPFPGPGERRHEERVTGAVIGERHHRRRIPER